MAIWLVLEQDGPELSSSDKLIISDVIISLYGCSISGGSVRGVEFPGMTFTQTKTVSNASAYDATINVGFSRVGKRECYVI